MSGRSRRIRASLIVAGALAVTLLVAGLVVAADFRGGAGPGVPAVELRVPPGASSRAIARQLDAAGLIDHPRIFDAYVRLEGAASDLKAGHYEIEPGVSYPDLLLALRSGAVVTIPLTIPEGLTIREVADRLAEYADRPADEVRSYLEDSARVAELGVPGPTLEGYLFPETYRFAEGVGLPAIVAELVARYQGFWGDAEHAKAEALGMDEREVVTLASIVEEEARIGDERPVIAGVYRNRLEIGMLLQADPTVQYALGEPRPRLLYSDIEAVADHPYNTYTQPGLPPGPIASPGAASLRAALEPAAHEFLFFVARIDGSHEFTRTVREHNNAKNRIRRERDAADR